MKSRSHIKRLGPLKAAILSAAILRNRSRRMPASRCPECAAVLDASRNMSPRTDRGPRPGEPMLCAKCGAIGVFAVDLTVRCPTDRELVRFLGGRHGVELLAIQEAIRSRNTEEADES